MMWNERYGYTLVKIGRPVYDEDMSMNKKQVEAQIINNIRTLSGMRIESSPLYNDVPVEHVAHGALGEMEHEVQLLINKLDAVLTSLRAASE